MIAGEILRAARHVLLDFDGPVCAVFGSIPDHQVADALRAEMTELGLSYPRDVTDMGDPFEVLWFAARAGQEVARQVEQRFRQCETAAVEGAPATAGTEELLRRLADSGQLVTIVSNNSTEAVRRYLGLRGLAKFVHGVSARDDAVVERLKPAPFLLERAMTDTGTNPEECVMIGDSATDIMAAQAAGTKVIALANKPEKRQRFAPLNPDGLVTGMTDL